MRTALLIAAAAALTASSAHAQTIEPPSIVVSGEGAVTAPPDIALVTSGVVTRAETAGAALKANASAMTRLMTAIKAAGVEERDVGTSGLSVQPIYAAQKSYSSDTEPKISGYQVRNTLSVRSRDIQKFGDLVDQMVAAGSNQIDALSFDVADREAKLDEARKAAVADARRKAELYAAAGVKLGPVRSMDEDVRGPEGPARPLAMRAQALDQAATPIARGEQELRVRVTVRWGIEP